MGSESTAKSVLPVFVKSELVPEGTTVFNLCEATEKVSGPASIDGATNISGLWRVYPLTEQARIKILNAPIRLNNTNFRFESFNPFIRRYGGQEVEGTRLIISNLPFSYSNKAVENNLRACGYRLRSQIQFEKARGPDRMLSDWKTGRRYVWVDVPTKTMSKNIKMGDFMAYIYYKEMKKSQECYKCLKVGHKASECENEEVCLTCRKPGHRRGDPVCGLDLVSEAEHSEEEDDEEKSNSEEDTNESEGKGKKSKDNEDNEGEGTDIDTEDDAEVSMNEDTEESSSTRQDEEDSEKEEGELNEEIQLSGEIKKDEHKDEIKTNELTDKVGNEVSLIQVSNGEDEVSEEKARDDSRPKKCKGKEPLLKKSNSKKEKKKKTNNKSRETKEIKTSSKNETPKSGLNQANLGDFGIGFKRSIREAPSPDEATGSPQKKGYKQK